MNRPAAVRRSHSTKTRWKLALSKQYTIGLGEVCSQLRPHVGAMGMIKATRVRESLGNNTCLTGWSNGRAPRSQMRSHSTARKAELLSAIAQRYIHINSLRVMKLCFGGRVVSGRPIELSDWACATESWQELPTDSCNWILLGHVRFVIWRDTNTTALTKRRPNSEFGESISLTFWVDSILLSRVLSSR